MAYSVFTLSRIQIKQMSGNMKSRCRLRSASYSFMLVHTRLLALDFLHNLNVFFFKFNQNMFDTLSG